MIIGDFFKQLTFYPTDTVSQLILKAAALLAYSVILDHSNHNKIPQDAGGTDGFTLKSDKGLSIPPKRWARRGLIEVTTSGVVNALMARYQAKCISLS